jgi:hypothetical protein
VACGQAPERRRTAARGVRPQARGTSTGGAAGGARERLGQRWLAGARRAAALASGSGAAMARWASGERLGRLGRSRSSSGGAQALGNWRAAQEEWMRGS